MSEVSIKWLELKRFVAIDRTNHSIVLSGTEKDGKIGIKPVDLLSMSLGSCMALSIIYYFQKNNQKLDDFEVKVKTKMRKDAPWSATDFHLTYSFWDKDLSDDFVSESIRVSEEELCGVTDVLKHATKITSEYHIYDYKDKLTI
jgi:putative redox protein